LGGSLVGLDPDSEDLMLTVRDDDLVFEVTIPAGTLLASGNGSFRYDDAGGSLGGLQSLRLSRAAGGATVLKVRTIPMPLAGADFVDHFMEVSLRGGASELTATPWWRALGSGLKTKS
jgi:hypothetical protein